MLHYIHKQSTQRISNFSHGISSSVAAFQAVFNIIALPGNLLVIATVILESSR